MLFLTVGRAGVDEGICSIFVIAYANVVSDTRGYGAVRSEEGKVVKATS